MIVAYLTNDEVNEDLAVQMADECSVTLHPISFGHALRKGRFDAVLYDWDSLPLGLRQQVLLESLAGRSSRPVALHSYSLEEVEVETLHQDGVAVFHRLEPEVFQTLRRLACPRSRGIQGRLLRRRHLALSY